MNFMQAASPIKENIPANQICVAKNIGVATIKKSTMTTEITTGATNATGGRNKKRLSSPYALA
jgi:hypothetical protein